eukprot:Lithocolla_globosa_v1_NODE_461_length_3991_cov_15.658283.p2 type:complete len:289 gc:universal NODE_461_length_3991_cov_15.658283:2769-3635(+)
MKSKKFVIVGDSKSGKTCFLSSLWCEKLPERYVETVFELYFQRGDVHNTKIDFELLDTAGSSSYERLRPLSYPQTDVVLISFSCDDPDSFANVREKWRGEILHFLPTTPVILVCMKTDLRNRLQTNAGEMVTTTQGVGMANDLGYHYMECSSKDKVGVQETIELACCLSIRKKQPLLSKEGSRSSLSLPSFSTMKNLYSKIKSQKNGKNLTNRDGFCCGLLYQPYCWEVERVVFLVCFKSKIVLPTEIACKIRDYLIFSEFRSPKPESKTRYYFNINQEHIEENKAST